MKTRIHKIIATAGGAGYFPVAPGTAGAVVGVLIFWLMHQIYFSVYEDPQVFLLLFIGMILLFLYLGVIATDHLEKEWGKDPSKVVMDEVIGVWIALLFVPVTWVNLLLAFALFRLFDIWKPLFIRKLEAIKGGWGVMLDDVLAGVYANIVLQVILYFWV